MEVPKLEQFSVGAIVYLVEKKKDDELRREAVEVAVEKFNESGESLSELIKIFHSSTGFKKEVVGDVVVTKLLKRPFFDLTLIDELLSSITSEFVWQLMTECKVIEVREKAYAEMLRRFDFYFVEDEELASIFHQKIEEDNSSEMSLRLRKKEYYG